jgi:hypothetical protein
VRLHVVAARAAQPQARGAGWPHGGGALISAIDPASACCKPFCSVALMNLLCFLYAFTGHAIPQQLRAPLCIAAGLQAQNTRARQRRVAVGSEDERIGVMSNTLLAVLALDEAFDGCELVSRAAMSRAAAGGSTDSATQEVMQAMLYAERAIGSSRQVGCPPRPLAAFACRTVAVVQTIVHVRGAGLVASAYGMLHCREAVQALVARWAAGPWAGAPARSSGPCHVDGVST